MVLSRLTVIMMIHHSKCSRILRRLCWAHSRLAHRYKHVPMRTFPWPRSHKQTCEGDRHKKVDYNPVRGWISQRPSRLLQWWMYFVSARGALGVGALSVWGLEYWAWGALGFWGSLSVVALSIFVQAYALMPQAFFLFLVFVRAYALMPQAFSFVYFSSLCPDAAGVFCF